LRVPADAAEGCYVPVYLQVTPSRASNVVTMAISTRPGPCVPTTFPRMQGQGKVGIAILSRTRIKSRSSDIVPIYDEALVSFVAASPQSKSYPLMLLPPPGTCTAFTSSFQSETI